MAAVQGAESLMRKLNKIGDVSPIVMQAMKGETQRVQRTAVMLCPVNHGELRQSIKTKVEQTEGMVIGTVYTNKKYAMYVEFGTGPKGQDNHNGISPLVNPTYTQQGWWFPGDKIPPADADRYHWPSMSTKDGKTLYYTQGQAAQPFMYPALRMNEDIVVMNLKAALCAGIERSTR